MIHLWSMLHALLGRCCGGASGAALAYIPWLKSSYTYATSAFDQVPKKSTQSKRFALMYTQWANWIMWLRWHPQSPCQASGSNHGDTVPTRGLGGWLRSICQLRRSVGRCFSKCAESKILGWRPWPWTLDVSRPVSLKSHCILMLCRDEMRDHWAPIARI